ncbi:glycosyltransferase [Psychrobacter sp. Ps1]|uniref:glycosyltransferase n=1 Tax=Psychrobacter sp. Ps1 TaxID=2790955 RepID=UPI001EE04526|nr:glycosyltransferase [Psychrobacter sp. Ps1]MCG3843599.1 glycosyltransferase [Psychrobacter sp. Ps1]
MKILYVITSLTQGGAQRVVCDLADAMFEKGHEVKIAYLTGEVITQPANEIELLSIGLTDAVTLPKAYFTLSKIIKGFKPDIIHAHMVHANILTRLVRLITPMSKLICTAHNSNEGGAVRMLSYRVTDRLANLTTNVSNTAVAAFEAVHAVPKNSMLTVYNGVDFTNFTYNSEAKKTIVKELSLSIDTKIILAVGRLNIQKNYFNLLNAINFIKKQSSTPFVLLIAGEGELQSEIEQLIKTLNISDNVILLGRRNDVPTLMSACDVFVLSSDYEGLPTVLIEALACQAQVVSTDVSGVHEILGAYGKIVPTKDPVALADAIKDSFQDNDKSVLTQKYVKSKFDLNFISDKWLKIYNEV